MDDMHNIQQDVSTRSSGYDVNYWNNINQQNAQQLAAIASQNGNSSSGTTSPLQGMEAVGYSAYNAAMQAASIVMAYKANQRNYKQNRELMAYQAELNEAAAQNDYNRMLALLSDERQYNLPSELRNRLSAAGFSPGVFMASGGSTISASMPTPGNTANSHGSGLNGMSSSSVYPVDPSAFSPVSLSQARLNEAAATKVEAETPTTDMFKTRYSSEITQMLSASGNSQASALWTDYQRNFESAVRNYRVGSVKASYDNLLTEGVSTLGQIIQSYASSTRDLQSSRLIDLQLNTEIINQAYLLSLRNKADADAGLSRASTFTEGARYDLFFNMAADYLQSAKWNEFYNDTMMKHFGDFKKGPRSTYGEMVLRDLRNTTSGSASNWSRATAGVIGDCAKELSGFLQPGSAAMKLFRH